MLQRPAPDFLLGAFRLHDIPSMPARLLPDHQYARFSLDACLAQNALRLYKEIPARSSGWILEQKTTKQINHPV